MYSSYRDPSMSIDKTHTVSPLPTSNRNMYSFYRVPSMFISKTYKVSLLAILQNTAATESILNTVLRQSSHNVLIHTGCCFSCASIINTCGCFEERRTILNIFMLSKQCLCQHREHEPQMPAGIENKETYCFKAYEFLWVGFGFG